MQPNTRFLKSTTTSVAAFLLVATFVQVGFVQVGTAQAEKNAELKPMLAELGSVVVTETFDNPISKPFVTAKGDWKAIDGILMGQELAADKHAAVLSYNQPNRNSVIRFSFKYEDKTKGFNLSWNHKGGHLFRVAVAPNRLAINLDKDKKDPKSKPVNLASIKGDFAAGQWHTMQVEVSGDKVIAQIDNGAIAKASHEKLDTDKPSYRFVMRGNSLALDDLHIWETK